MAELPRLRLMTRQERGRRSRQLVRELGQLEGRMRDVCAELLDLAEPGDDLGAAVGRLLVALEG